MDNKKFEQLIDLIINENEEQARELFHDIVVEKSREIYESIMDEEMMGEEGMGGSQVGGLLDEINAEEAGGMTEEEDEDSPFDDSEEVIDIDSDDMDHEEGGGEIEDSVIRIEDKLDQLMAEFEQIMGGGDDEMAADDDMAAADDEMAAGDDEMDDEMMESDDLEEEDVMEAVQLKQVPGLYGSKIGGDNGAYTRSPSLHDPKIKAAGVNPVKFSGQSETVPTSPKGPSNYGSKGETTVKGAGSFKNSPGQDAGKSSFKEKVPGGFGHKTPQGKEVGAGGSVSQNDKSVLESRRTAAKKRI